MKTGIYKILNKRNNKIYVGSAVDIKKRWRDHKWHLIHNIHHNPHLQLSWNKYGIDSFEFSIILECSITDLLINELKFITLYNSFDSNYGYNVNDPEHTFLNRKHSEKTKEILSKKKLGINNPMYGKCGNKHHNYMKKMPIEVKNKISIAKRGIPTHKQTHTKLNSFDIINVRKMYHIKKISQPKIANLYNVSYTAINKIITRKTWSEVA
jgi:group I intron endonuclease